MAVAVAVAGVVVQQQEEAAQEGHKQQLLLLRRQPQTGPLQMASHPMAKAAASDRGELGGCQPRLPCHRSSRVAMGELTHTHITS